MRKLMTKLLVILAYLWILLFLSGFDLIVLFDIRTIVLTVLGSLLLSIPHYQKGLTRKDRFSILGKNALATSYIETFIYLFARLNNAAGFDHLLPDIALNCRPILYGFIIYMALKNDDNQISNDPKGTDQKTSERKVTAEEIDLALKEFGLTTREVEISRLILSGYSNNEIAEELFISETTVKKHISNVFGKLQITKREQIKTVIMNR